MIPLSKPYIGTEEIYAVLDVLRSGQLSLGPKLLQFEQDFASYMGMKYAVAVSSGTAGLHLAVRALDIKEGDEVITSPFSFIASANSILFEKATPVFVDIDEKTFNLDPRKVEAAITPRTKAILPVHIFGQSADMNALVPIARKYNLKIIEDACESLGAVHNGALVGTQGDISVFAFYPNKQMTTGEGGMIVTNNLYLYEMCKSLRNQGRTSSTWLEHVHVGYNYRLDEMSCALGIEQLKKLPLILKMREAVARQYNQQLQGIPGITLPFVAPGNSISWFVYVIRLESHVNRAAVMEQLAQRGIASREYLPAIHLQECYKRSYGFVSGSFPVCERVSSSTLALPFYTSLSFADVDFVCASLREILLRCAYGVC